MNGLFVDQLNLDVREFGFHGKSAYFNGINSSIEVPALTNVQFSQFTVSMWFRRVGDDTKVEGLVDNADCRTGGSIHVLSIDQSHVSARFATSRSNVSINAQQVMVNKGKTMPEAHLHGPNQVSL